MIELYHQLLTEPILNLLVWIVNVLPGHDFGVAVIIVTLIIRFILLPLSAKSLRAQRSLTVLQPKMNEIKEKRKDDKQKQSEELMRFYQQNKVNPLSSCLPLLIQMPIILALYHVFRDGLNEESFTRLYSFVEAPEIVNTLFFGIVDLSVPNIVLAVLAAAAQFFQAKYMLARRDKQKKSSPKKEEKKKSDKPSPENIGDMASAMSKQMVYIMPAVTLFIAMTLPSALALYWITTTVFAIVQQVVIFRSMEEDADTSLDQANKTNASKA